MNMPVLSIPADEYHADSRSGKFLSSHLLADFRESPALYHKKTTGGIIENENPALTLGRAAHCLILEGKGAFDAQYTVSDGPVNARTGEPFGRTTKAYSEWLAAQTGEILGSRDYAFISRLQKAVMLSGEASRILEDGAPEGVIRAEYCGVLCQIRMDWFSEKTGLADLKTCSSLRWFEHDCRSYGYLFQMAFYRALIRIVSGVDVPVRFIAVEKAEPFSAGVWEIAPEVLDEAERVNEAALRKFRRCRERGVWPTGYEEPQLITQL